MPKTSELYAALEEGKIIEFPPSTEPLFPEKLTELGHVRHGLLVKLKDNRLFIVKGSFGSCVVKKLEIFESLIEMPENWTVLTEEELEERNRKNEEAKAAFVKGE
jgi:hypothetical protein